MINESKLNDRMFHLMERGFFGKQLLNEETLNLNDNMKVRIFQTLYNYLSLYEVTLRVKNNGKYFKPDGTPVGEAKIYALAIDGILGKKTYEALNNLANFDPIWIAGWNKPIILNNPQDTSEFYSFLISDETSINRPGGNKVHFLQVILCLAGRIEVIPDGVIGTKTKAAMRDLFGTEDMNKIPQDKFKAVIQKVVQNIKDSDLSLKYTIEGKSSSEKTNTSSEKSNTSSEKTNTSSKKSSFADKYFNTDGYDAIFVAGSTSVVSMEDQLKSFKDGFGKDKNVATFFYTGTPYGHKQTIAQVLAENPKIPAFLFSAGVWRASDVVSNGNADLNKVYIIHPHGDNKPLVDRATAAGLPIKNVFVSKFYGHGSNIPKATPTATNDHMAALTEVAREHSV